MKKTFIFALKTSAPVFFGYIFLGAAYGLMLENAGYNWIWALFCSTVVYAGSGQFLLTGLLAEGAGLVTVAAMTLLLNSRHIFYGLSFVERFRGMRARSYMIFSLTDETYSVLSSTKIPPEIDEKRAFLLIALLDQLYWIAGSVLGAALGGATSFDTRGVEFAMTALFVVLLVEQLINNPGAKRLACVFGGGAALVSRLILGAENFLFPALVAAVALLLIFRRRIETGEKGAAE